MRKKFIEHKVCFSLLVLKHLGSRFKSESFQACFYWVITQWFAVGEKCVGKLWPCSTQLHSDIVLVLNFYTQFFCEIGVCKDATEKDDDINDSKNPDCATCDNKSIDPICGSDNRQGYIFPFSKAEMF